MKTIDICKVNGFTQVHYTAAKVEYFKGVINANSDKLKSSLIKVNAMSVRNLKTKRAVHYFFADVLTIILVFLIKNIFYGSYKISAEPKITYPHTITNDKLLKKQELSGLKFSRIGWLLELKLWNMVHRQIC